MLRKATQLLLRGTQGHGGARPGAGRKASGRRVVAHDRRAVHRARHPVHVTMRVREGLPSFRSDRLVWQAVRSALGAGHRSDFRVVHFSVQSNHLHLVVEAHDTLALSRGMQGLTVRMARRVNRALGSSGAVFGERYHAHELTTPRETRNALLYVLQNWMKHGRGEGFDPRSSAAWFDGWRVPPPAADGESPPVAKPRTWLVTVGWRRHGLLRPGEQPGDRLATD